MPGRLVRSLLPLAALAVALTAAPAASASAHPAQDPVVITPNKYFKGLINNHPPGQATILVVCPGGASSGHPAGGQTIEVESIPKPTSTSSDVGFTGSSGKAITAALAPATSHIVLAHFTSFYAPTTIPTTITVPCSGTGKVDFVPSPTSKTAKTAVLAVTFGPGPGA